MAANRTIQLSDGAVLNAIEAGSGQPLVMIPGWSQSAAEYGRNIEELAKTRRVIALDMRSHGESSNAKTGHRIQRLAKDLREVLEALGIDRADVLGHSMGSSIIWSYLDMYGEDRLRRLVIVDQAPMVAALPGWDEATKKQYGCLLPDVQSVAGFSDVVRATDSVDGTMGILKGMFTVGDAGGGPALDRHREPQDAARRRGRSAVRPLPQRLARRHHGDAPSLPRRRRAQEHLLGGIAGVDRLRQPQCQGLDL